MKTEEKITPRWEALAEIILLIQEQEEGDDD